MPALVKGIPYILVPDQGIDSETFEQQLQAHGIHYISNLDNVYFAVISEPSELDNIKLPGTASELTCIIGFTWLCPDDGALSAVCVRNTEVKIDSVTKNKYVEYIFWFNF